MEAVMGDGTQRFPLGKVKDYTAGYRQLVETPYGFSFRKEGFAALFPKPS